MTSNLTAAVMAKVPEPGRVKTRLAGAEGVGPVRAAEIAWAMLRCTIERLRPHGPVSLAVSPDGAGDRLAARLDLEGVEVIDQGDGTLGDRIERVWRRVARDRPVAFFGADSPDVPDTLLRAIEVALDDHDAAIGPTPDGGYWTLAARRYLPPLVDDIDWGGDCVYDQTLERARAAGLTVSPLPFWDDVDRAVDVRALQRRLAVLCGATTPVLAAADPLRRLADRLHALCGAPPAPGAPPPVPPPSQGPC